MCRPNYSQWILGEEKIKSKNIDYPIPNIFTIAGEGSHSRIAEKKRLDYFIVRSLPDFTNIKLGAGELFIDGESIGNISEDTNLQIVKYQEDCFTTKDMFPFECIWSESPIIKFQPNVNKFYSIDELPTKNDFKTAQSKLDEEIGTIDRLFNWINEAVKLYISDKDFDSIFLDNLNNFYINTITGATSKRFTIVSEINKLIAKEIGFTKKFDKFNNITINEFIEKVIIKLEFLIIYLNYGEIG